MILTKEEYFTYKKQNDYKSIYVAFTNCKGLGKNKYLIFNIWKILGYNIFTSKKKFSNINLKKDNILLFFLSKFLKRKLGNFELEKRKYFLRHKIVKTSLREIRFSAGLPVNGQRTRTNARTSRKLNSKILALINTRK